MDTDDTVSDAPKRQIFQHLINVAWFFFCVFGANATLGSFFYLLQYPNNEILLQTGVFGGSVAAVGLAGLYAAQAFTRGDTPILQRITAVVVLLCSLCGAAAALGTYFLIVLNVRDAAYLMQNGIISFAALLVVTGTMKLAESYAMSTEVEEQDAVY